MSWQTFWQFLSDMFLVKSSTKHIIFMQITQFDGCHSNKNAYIWENIKNQLFRRYMANGA